MMEATVAPSLTLLPGTFEIKGASVNVTERRRWSSLVSLSIASPDALTGRPDLGDVSVTACDGGVNSTVVVTTLALTFVSRTGLLRGEPGNTFALHGGETAQAYSTDPEGDLGALRCTDNVESWRLGMLTSSGSKTDDSRDLSELERLLLLLSENLNSLPLLTARLEDRTWAPENSLQEPALKLRQA